MQHIVDYANYTSNRIAAFLSTDNAYANVKKFARSPYPCNAYLLYCKIPNSSVFEVYIITNKFTTTAKAMLPGVYN